MRVLVACEFSGTVRDAFLALGHDAVSCDLLPTESPGPHHQGDVREILGDGWDLMVAHPPCTYLCNSGARWLYEEEGRWEKLQVGAEFFKEMLDAPIPMRAIENPVMHKHAVGIIGRRQDQLVQPWHFGHKEIKATCFWLDGLPRLVHTRVVGPPPKDKKELRRWARVHRASPGVNRWKERSLTYSGIAQAMAEQWGGWT